MVLNHIYARKTISQSSEPEAARAAAAQLLPRPVAASVGSFEATVGWAVAAFVEKSEAMKQTHLSSLPRETVTQ